MTSMTNVLSLYSRYDIIYQIRIVASKAWFSLQDGICYEGSLVSHGNSTTLPQNMEKVDVYILKGKILGWVDFQMLLQTLLC